MNKKDFNDRRPAAEAYAHLAAVPEPPADSYAALCSLEALQAAYEKLRKDVQDDHRHFENVETASVQALLNRLSKELRAGTYRPSPTAQLNTTMRLLEGGNATWVGDQVVEVALKRIVDGPLAAEVLFTEPEKAMQYLAAAVEKGLTRAYAVTIDGSLDKVHKAQLLQQINQRIEDRDTLGLFEKVFDAWLERQAMADKSRELAKQASGTSSDSAQRLMMPPVLASVVYAGVDNILQQADLIGRHETFSLVKTARFGNKVVILSAPNDGLDWVLPAVERRLREELQRFRFEFNGSETQFADFGRGGKLRLLGLELYCVAGKSGAPSVRYKRIEKAPRARVNEGLRNSPRKVGQRLHWPTSVKRFGWHSPQNRWIYALLALVFIEVCVAGLAFWPSSANDPLRYQKFARPSGDEVDYAMYVPSGYDSGRRYPLIVFLHGNGQRGMDGTVEYFPGIHLAIRLAAERGERFEFVVLFPLPRSASWTPGSDDSRLVTELVDEVCKSFSVDADRIYLTGVGDGGTGVWNLAAEYPDRWAAIVPVSSSPNPAIAARVAHLPCWCFEGEYSGIKLARGMIKALEEASGKPRLTEVRGMGHTIWNQAYLDKELYSWLADQRRGG
jgi:pimeloyl-ACP methyl ester carboxylesterase